MKVVKFISIVLGLPLLAFLLYLAFKKPKPYVQPKTHIITTNATGVPVYADGNAIFITGAQI